MNQILLFLSAILISTVSIGSSSPDKPISKSILLPVQIIAQVDVKKIDPMPETTAKFEVSKVPMPPSWLETVMGVAMKIPIVGPLLLQVMQWLGLIASVLTVLVTALMGAIQALNVILKWAKLTDLAVKVIAFQNSPIMYWLKYLSIYNAKKEVAQVLPQNKPKV